MHDKTWIIVANSSTARIIKANNNKELEEIERLEHPESRAKGQDLVSDKPSSGFSRSGGVGSHGTAETDEPKKHEAGRFAGEVAERLSQAFKAGEFENLYLVAGPQFLGVLSEVIEPNVMQKVLEKVSKDLTSQQLEEIRKQLPYVL